MNIDLIIKLWPIAVGIGGIIVVLAQQHTRVKFLEEKVKTLFDILNKK